MGGKIRAEVGVIIVGVGGGGGGGSFKGTISSRGRVGVVGVVGLMGEGVGVVGKRGRVRMEVGV